MTRGKKVFLGFFVAFLLIIMYIAYDIATKTTFPGKARKSDVEDEMPDIQGDSIPVLENI